MDSVPSADLPEFFLAKPHHSRLHRLPFRQIRHTKGKFTCNIAGALYTFFATLWYGILYRDLVAHFQIGPNTYHNPPDRAWRKLCGTKSGIRTQTNGEWLIAYRQIGDQIEIAKYIRRTSTHNQWQVVATQAYYAKDRTLIISIPFSFFYALPIYPYSGGHIPPTQNYSFGLCLEPAKRFQEFRK